MTPHPLPVFLNLGFSLFLLWVKPPLPPGSPVSAPVLAPSSLCCPRSASPEGWLVAPCVSPRPRLGLGPRVPDFLGLSFPCAPAHPVGVKATSRDLSSSTPPGPPGLLRHCQRSVPGPLGGCTALGPGAPWGVAVGTLPSWVSRGWGGVWSPGAVCCPVDSLRWALGAGAGDWAGKRQGPSREPQPPQRGAEFGVLGPWGRTRLLTRACWAPCPPSHLSLLGVKCLARCWPQATLGVQAWPGPQPWRTVADGPAAELGAREGLELPKGPTRTPALAQSRVARPPCGSSCWAGEGGARRVGTTAGPWGGHPAHLT